ncbi:MAG: Ig-like domain-containing protein [Candidatus Woesearchaeota archaeon]
MGDMMKILTVLLITTLLLAGCQVAPSTDNNDTILLNLSTDELTSPEDTENVSTPSEPTQEDLSPSGTIPSRTFKEGDLVRFRQDMAFDPDGGDIEYTFTEPIGPDGTWQTEIGDAGEYLITITAFDGVLSSSQQVRLIIEAVNRPPVISNFEDITVYEGETIVLEPIVEDPDGDAVTLRYSGFMTSNTYTTTFNDAGEHRVTLTASDGFHDVVKTITVTVIDVNRPPVLSPIEDIIVTEGELVEVSFEASDPDGDAISVTFSDPVSDEGVWQTEVGDAGTYEIDVSVSDGELTTTETFRITVARLNNPPVIVAPDVIEVEETETIVIDAEISDPDGDEVTVTYEGFMNSSTRTTDFGDAGEYSVRIIATDGIDTTTHDITIIINRRNRPPVFTGEFFE